MISGPSLVCLGVTKPCNPNLLPVEIRTSQDDSGILLHPRVAVGRRIPAVLQVFGIERGSDIDDVRPRQAILQRKQSSHMYR